jgi:hypothetical protein
MQYGGGAADPDEVTGADEPQPASSIAARATIIGTRFKSSMPRSGKSSRFHRPYS